MTHDILVSGGLVVYPEKTVRADVAVDGERIAAVAEPGSCEASARSTPRDAMFFRA